MWASTHAISGFTKFGTDVGWSCHPMEHELSAYYDITHGVGLAILTPRWMKHILSPETAWKFGQYGREVWGLTGDDDLAVGEAAIEKTAEFFYDVLGLPRTLTEVGIGEEKLEIMAANCAPNLRGAFVPLSEKDVLDIFRACL